MFKEKALVKELTELFYRGEELKTALGTISDVYDCMVSVVYEQNGKNRVLCSTELNIDRLDALNHQLIRMRITKEEVLSYDGMYSHYKAYPLNTSLLEGAVLLDADKTVPTLSEELLRLLAMYVRHEKMERELSISHLYDSTTGLKNREGLAEALAEESRKEEKSFEYLACIRLLNRAEMLNKLGCHYDTDLLVKCSNEILRRIKRQVYRIGIDTWAILLVKGMEEGLLQANFCDLIEDLSEAVRGTRFYAAVTRLEGDLFYSLFLCESSALKAEDSRVTFLQSYREGELTDYMRTEFVNVENSQLKEPADFFQESEIYNLNRADATEVEKEEPLIESENYQELDEFGDPVEEGAAFEYGEAFGEGRKEEKKEE